MYIGFNSEQLNRLFPFHILIGEGLEIVTAGRSLSKIYSLENEASFFEHFIVKRPELIANSFQALKAEVNKLLVIETIEAQPVALRGQFEFLQDTNQLLFLGSPWFE